MILRSKLAESGVQNSLAYKLRIARTLIGLSTRAVANVLAPRFKISHTTVANYENGATVPPMDILMALSTVYDRPINWFLTRSVGLSGVRYRNLHSKTKPSDLLRFEADTQRWLDAYVALEERLKKRVIKATTHPSATKFPEPADLAREVRRSLNLSLEEPVPSVVAVLEQFGIRVVEVPSDLRIDGLAAAYGDSFVVALNPTVSNERARLNAAHELAHVLYGDCHAESESPEIEKRAYAFGSNFLIPNSQLKNAFEGFSIVRMIQFKERFGISLASMVYRAEQLGFISKGVAKSLWTEFSKRGWRTQEPGTVRPDRATRLEQLMDEGILSNQMSIKEVAEICGVRPSDVRSRLNAAMGMSDSESEEPETISFTEGFNRAKS